MRKPLKVPLGDLREALRNPRAFVRNQGAGRSGFGRNRYMELRDVALAFHKENDVDASVASLEERLNRYKTTRDNEQYLSKLREYVSNFEALGTAVARVRSNIVLPTPEGYNDFRITGQVTRLDVDPAAGYRAWIFASRTEDWDDDLRFPLMQAACASQLDVDVEEVVPGVYDFSAGTYNVFQSTKRKVQNARRQLLSLLDEMAKYRK
jgi:hypothetical protein